MGKSVKNIFPLACVFIVLIALGYVLYRAVLVYDEPVRSTGEVAVSSSNPLRKLKSASLVVPNLGTRVMLADGEVRFLVDGARALGMVQIGDIAEEKNIAGVDSVVTYINVSDGSGRILQYLILFSVEGDDILYRSSAMLGDRIRVQRIMIGSSSQESKVTVDMLERKAGESVTSAPTVPVKKVFTLRSGKLIANK